jgi:hypothetical protein
MLATSFDDFDMGRKYHAFSRQRTKRSIPWVCKKGHVSSSAYTWCTGGAVSRATMQTSSGLSGGGAESRPVGVAIILDTRLCRWCRLLRSCRWLGRMCFWLQNEGIVMSVDEPVDLKQF